MLTPGLEALIQTGKAKAMTFTFGAGGAGRIPVPQNKFIIIHHFDYFHFVDTPAAVTDSPATMAVGYFVDGVPPPFDAKFNFPGFGSFIASIDQASFGTSIFNVNVQLQLLFPGWLVFGTIDISTGFRYFNFITTSPGTIYNGILPEMIPIPVDPPGWAQHGVLSAGGTTFAPLLVADFLTHHTHQIKFNSGKSSNSFVIQEPVVVFPQQATVNPVQKDFFAYLTESMYPKDCYLVHTETVQIDVVGVPDVSQWFIFPMANPDNKSQEFALPRGYGNTSAGQPVVRNLVFDAAFFTQQYMPLTIEFETAAPIANQYREQFEVDVNSFNALFNPANVSGIFGNVPTYPLVNIDYVLVNMNYNEFVQQSD